MDLILTLDNYLNFPRSLIRVRNADYLRYGCRLIDDSFWLILIIDFRQIRLT